MKKIFSITLLASALLAGCTTESVDSTTPIQTTEMDVTAGISGTATTKAIRDGVAFSNNDNISVFITGIGYTPKTALYTLSSALWTSPTSLTDKIFLSNELATVYGFYPSDAIVVTPMSNDNMNKINVTLAAAEASFNGTGQKDYMYSTQVTVSNALNAEKANLNFKHALSKLTFVVNRGTFYTGTGNITAIKLAKTSDFNVSPGTMAITDGILVWTAPKVSEISFTGSANINAYNSTTPSIVTIATGMVAPRTDNSGITLKLTIDGKEMSIPLPNITGSGSSWVPGTNYRYTIGVDATELNIISVAITDWTTTDAGSVNVK